MKREVKRRRRLARRDRELDGIPARSGIQTMDIATPSEPREGLITSGPNLVGTTEWAEDGVMYVVERATRSIWPKYDDVQAHGDLADA